MRTLKEVLQKSRDYLEQKGVSSPRREAEEVLSRALGIPRIELYLKFEQPLEERELEFIRNYLARRAKGEPHQYIEGEVSFYDSIFKVSSHVLIPRPETEQLVEKIAKELHNQNLDQKILWDLCCGSGCVGLSLKKLYPHLRVVLSDICSDALKVAKENAKCLDLEVEFYQGDLLSAFSEPVDYLVSNPPYISEQDFKTLQVEVKDYEPKKALVPGATGLEIYEQLAKNLKKVLKKPSKVWFEIGNRQKRDLQKLFENETEFKIFFEKDYAGCDRFFSLELE